MSRHLHHNEAAVSPSHPDHSLEEEGGGDGDGDFRWDSILIFAKMAWEGEGRALTGGGALAGGGVGGGGVGTFVGCTTQT